MTSFPKTSSFSDIEQKDTLSTYTLSYFREQLSSDVYALVMSEFNRAKQTLGLTKAAFARRIGRDPARLNRLLNSPGNWTLETVSDLVVGLGCEPVFDVTRFSEQETFDIRPPDWVSQSTLKFSVPPKANTKDVTEMPVHKGSALGHNVVEIRPYFKTQDTRDVWVE